MDLLLGNDGLAALIAFALVLIPAVIIHELGHFFAGKSVGITILEFGIGFPPRIGRLFTWRGTEFTLNWLPLGGFVRPLGEDMVRQKGEDEENLDRQEAEERGITEIKSVGEAKPLDRIWFLSAGAIFNLISAFFLFVAVGMLGVPGVSVDIANVDSSSDLYQAGLRPNDVIESVNGRNFLTMGEFLEYLASVDTAEILVRRGEEGEVVILDYDVPNDFVGAITDSYVRVMAVEEGSPAADTGILPGDLIHSFNEERVVTVLELQNRTAENRGQLVDLELLREEDSVTVSLVPRENPPEGQGSIGIRIQGAAANDELGIVYQPLANQVLVELSFWEATQYSMNRFTGIFVSIAQVPTMLIRGEISAEEARPVSIVGISQMGGRFLRESIEEDRPVVILNYIAVISIALGLTNLLPLPALDGGRILFVLIEMVRGRPIPPEREGIVHLLGLIFLLSVTVIVIINDIVNPITELIP